MVAALAPGGAAAQQGHPADLTAGFLGMSSQAQRVLRGHMALQGSRLGELDLRRSLSTSTTIFSCGLRLPIVVGRMEGPGGGTPAQAHRAFFSRPRARHSSGAACSGQRRRQACTAHANPMHSSPCAVAYAPAHAQPTPHAWNPSPYFFLSRLAIPAHRDSHMPSCLSAKVEEPRGAQDRGPMTQRGGGRGVGWGVPLLSGEA